MLRPRWVVSSLASSLVRARRSLVTLAIETSCDDTAVAVLQRSGSPPRTELLFNERISSDNRAFKGIHPLQTIQSHNAELAPLVRRAMAYLPASATTTTTMTTKPPSAPDFVCVTRGPGITSNLATGLSTAKGLAVAWGVPLVGVHHMQAHALTPRLVRALGIAMAGEEEEDGRESRSGPEFPFLSLLVSGGHTQLVHSAALADHRIVATTADTAIGNMLDQTARVILPPAVLAASPDVMYGRLLESFAFAHQEADGKDSTSSNGSHYAWFEPPASRAAEIQDVPSGYDWAVSLPLRQTRKLAYSFSSIYTQVHEIAAARPAMDVAERRALARHTMRAAFSHLTSRLCLALDDVPSLRAATTLVVAGGVASNRFLMHVLRETLRARGHQHLRVVAPPAALCTDNAAMIAWAGMEMFEAGYCSDLSVLPIGKWPMDPADERGGILGVDGWLRRDAI